MLTHKPVAVLRRLLGNASSVAVGQEWLVSGDGTNAMFAPISPGNSAALKPFAGDRGIARIFTIRLTTTTTMASIAPATPKRRWMFVWRDAMSVV